MRLCSVEGCGRKLGHTGPHSKLCSVVGCGRKHKAKGLCQEHRRMQKQGKALKPVGNWGAIPGESNSFAKLKTSDVVAIKKAIKSVSRATLSEMYRISAMAISDIAEARTWAHVQVTDPD